MSFFSTSGVKRALIKKDRLNDQRKYSSLFQNEIGSRKVSFTTAFIKFLNRMKQFFSKTHFNLRHSFKFKLDIQYL